ncbi:hypothetical protein B4067_3650 [Bacillus subtilis subsp. subtilis]|uniref:Uncharacterized protein n=1 Tax=Bacillus subtilis subsp. subtilis TaxID=135461 RepID=A0ABD3ZNK0_BACIU|nr:hypothetical protein B4067_3650 [Bacillus subtilis subsp. subtilis]
MSGIRRRIKPNPFMCRTATRLLTGIMNEQFGYVRYQREQFDGDQQKRR